MHPKRFGSIVFTAAFSLQVAGVVLAAPAATRSPYEQGVDLYKAGRFSEATDAFDHAIKKRDHDQDATAYIERIRKETVERIRNRALTGVSKTNWQSKFYYMNAVQNRIRVGISSQELFERDSTNFRPGAVEALSQIAATLQKADNARVDIDLINELNQESNADPQISAQQLAAVFSYLSLATRDSLPRF
jgi:outer membrane protein OmpA-like peptidoglycan-associated protein